VEAWPSATMARLSPTRIVSIPAWSAAWAEGKSCAVNTWVGSLAWGNFWGKKESDALVMGSPFLYIVFRVWRVTFLRWIEGGWPIGE